MIAELVEARQTTGPSMREIQVLELIAKGRIDKEIADELGISVPTVRVYRKRTQVKLGTQNTMQTILVAWRKGYIDLQEISQEALTLSDERHSRTRTLAPGLRSTL